MFKKRRGKKDMGSRKQWLSRRTGVKGSLWEPFTRPTGQLGEEELGRDYKRDTSKKTKAGALSMLRVSGDCQICRGLGMNL